MYGHAGAFQNTQIQDPNLQRLLQETISSVDDVERRLVGLKLNIAQAFPHLAQALQQRELQTREQTATLLARVVPNVGMGGVGGIGIGQGMPNVPFGGIGNVGQSFGISPFTPNVGVGSFGTGVGIPQLGQLTTGVSPFGGPTPWFLGNTSRPW